MNQSSLFFDNFHVHSLMIRILPKSFDLIWSVRFWQLISHVDLMPLTSRAIICSFYIFQVSRATFSVDSISWSIAFARLWTYQTVFLQWITLHASHVVVLLYFQLCIGFLSFSLPSVTDMVVLEFQHYAPGSRWRQTTVSRKDHREKGDETDGFYGGIRKLQTKDEISTWRRFWPVDVLNWRSYLQLVCTPPFQIPYVQLWRAFSTCLE